MDYIHLQNLKLENTPIEKLTVFLDDNGGVILLPLLWSIHISSTLTTYKKVRALVGHKRSSHQSKKEKLSSHLEEYDINQKTAADYKYCVHKFLCHVNEVHHQTSKMSVHNLELVSTPFVNQYLNEVLPEKVSNVSLEKHKAALVSFLNFMSALKIKEPLEPRIYPKSIKIGIKNRKKGNKVQYISKVERSKLLMACNNDRDKLIIRMGYEVGLRASECRGLELGKHKAKNRLNEGLLNIFDSFDPDDMSKAYPFLLNGKYAKGGKSRTIFFDGALVKAMLDYYNNERKEIMDSSQMECGTLFVKNDNEGRGKPISARHPTMLFNRLASQIPEIDKNLSYHDLRHTYATIEYHNQIERNGRRGTRSENAALYEVAEKLGHADIATTIKYIRLRLLMLEIESDA